MPLAASTRNLVRTQSDRADQSKARILEAAIAEFSENGLAGARTVPVARRLLRWQGVAEADQGAKRRRFKFPPRRLGNLRVDHYLRHACPYRAIRDQVPARCGQVADKGILPLGAPAEKGGAPAVRPARRWPR